MGARTAEEVTARVAEFLSARFAAEQDHEGAFTVTQGSALCFAFVNAVGDSDAVVVCLSAPVASDVPETPELLEHVARSSDSWVFGHLVLVADDGVPGTVSLDVVHEMLGNYLDEEELAAAVTAVLAAATEIGPAIHARFGGTRRV